MFSLIKEMFDDDPLMIVPYLSYANSEQIHVRGRIISDASIIVSEQDTILDNMSNSVKRMFTSKGKYLPIKLRIDGREYESQSDDDGYFEFIVPYRGSVISDARIEWMQGYLSLIDNQHANSQSHSQSNNGTDNESMNATVNIMQAPAQSTFGVITDIDDTILQSYVNSFLKWRLLYETFLKNAGTRVAFEQVAQALQALACDGGAVHINPLFYISHSPWNLYDMLRRFFRLNGIPEGPLFLRDAGIKTGQARIEYKQHKRLAIDKVIGFYESLPFVMLGDATEHDVDIYLQAYHRWPERIQMIMIRASKSEKRNQRILALKREHPDVPLHLIRHSQEIIDLCLSC